MAAAAAAAVLGLLVATGCTVPAVPPASLPIRDRTGAAQATLDALLAAVHAGDRSGFDAQVSLRDPAFAGRADVWFANLKTLSAHGWRWRALPRTADVTDRAHLLGPDAWLQRVVVEWRPPGSRQPAETPIWLTFAAEGDGGVLAGDGDAPAGDEAPAWPTWLAGATRVAERGPVVVVGSAGSLPLWLGRGEAAVSAVSERAGGLGLRWSGPLVIEVPNTRAAFERSLGPSTSSGEPVANPPTGSGYESTDSYPRIGAVAWPRGTGRPRAVHVVVNPEVVAGLSAEGVAVLLAHEATHVMTRSVDSPAPTWLVEGMADYLAYSAHPTTQPAAEEPLRRALEAGWRPAAPPPESAFAANGDQLDLAYAQSWSLCRRLAERYGESRLGRFYRSVDAGTPVRDAARVAFGQNIDALVRDWSADLSRLARR